MAKKVSNLRCRSSIDEEEIILQEQYTDYIREFVGVFVGAFITALFVLFLIHMFLQGISSGPAKPTPGENKWEGQMTVNDIKTSDGGIGIGIFDITISAVFGLIVPLAGIERRAFVIGEGVVRVLERESPGNPYVIEKTINDIKDMEISGSTVRFEGLNSDDIEIRGSPEPTKIQDEIYDLT
jgi:hypothetical protein